MEAYLVTVVIVYLCTITTVVATSEKPGAPSKQSNRVVLVTGAAGFIGFHVAKHLVEDWSVREVVGLDLFNDYYDKQLKKDRASKLLDIGVKLYRGDVCDQQLLRYLMLKYNFTDIVHMAAQAGVRYSLEDPQAYVAANYQCFISLLDSLVEFPAFLVYASSSSVYGKRASVPFSSDEPLRAPGNLYAASKIMNEHLASAYCSQHGLLSIGLRFFTVYGPWGRPDMAAYKFAEKIVTGMPLTLFEAGPGQQLKRDFTYIDDIVSGVLSALDHVPNRCGEAFNLGYGQPRVVEEMLEYLQQELDIPAIIDRQPLPPSDMILTFADITTSSEVLGFYPKTSTAEGIHHFVIWFKDYYNDLVQWEKNGRDPTRNKQLEQSLEERDKEITAYKLQETSAINNHYQQTLTSLRERYIQYAQDNEIPQPNLNKKEFILYEGKQSPGYTVIKAPGYHGDTQSLKKHCLATEQCIAFTSDGEFKNNLQPSQQWLDSTEDLYVADMDVCLADLHMCGANSYCINSGPGTYDCQCIEGYQRLGRSCIEVYKEGQISISESEWRLCDVIDGVNWTNVVAGKEFVFFPGLDSPGGDYLVTNINDDIKEACRKTHHCIAYNTNGILKHSLQSPQNWHQWTDDRHHGIYVLDIDYCQLAIEQCPTHSHCVRSAPGNYSCHCLPSYHTTKTGGCDLSLNQQQQQQEEEMSIVLSLDEHHIQGLATLLRSLWQHTPYVEQLKVYIIAIDMSSDTLLSYLACHHISTHQVEIMELSSLAIDLRRHVVDSPDIVGNLASAANFARFQVPQLLPHLQHILYLDIDIVVQSDISEIWYHLMTSKKMMVAVPRSSVTYGGFFSNNVKQLFKKRYGLTYEDSDPTFNAGVWGMNLDLWREQHIYEEVIYWTEQHAQQPLWRFGTQPILLLLAYNQWDHLPLEWNVDGLGWNQDIPQHRLTSAKILHWSGRGKPWLTNGFYRDLWTSYQPMECSGHGKCEEDRDIWLCKCDNSFSGVLCNH